MMIFLFLSQIGKMIRVWIFFFGLCGFVLGGVQRVSIEVVSKKSSSSFAEVKVHKAIPVKAKTILRKNPPKPISKMVQTSMMKLIITQVPILENVNIQKRIEKVTQIQRSYIPVIGILVSIAILVLEVLLVVWLINGRIG